MGIENFSGLLKRYCPNAKKDLFLSEFINKKVAIDANNYIHKHMAISQSGYVESDEFYKTGVVDTKKVFDNCKKSIIKLLLNILSVGVIPVFVLDGKRREEKEITSGKRRAQRTKDSEELRKVQEELDKNELMDVDKLMARRKTLLKRLYEIDSSHYKEMEEIVRKMGIPVYRAQYDGEELCSYLCNKGLVEAVISTDSDCLVFGCTNLITNLGYFKYSSKTKRFDCDIKMVKLKDLLEELDFTQEQFIDLCILMGCDFNIKIKGMGLVGCHTQMCEHKNYSNFSNNTKKDTSTLNYDRCLEIFKLEASEFEDFIVEDFELRILSDTIEDLFGSLGLSWEFNKLKNLIEPED